ncbi:hypothetical protein CPB84DRAFT_1769741 [Gymnopilus junonius]|uniref:Uncharacterized protein n=1 Tax=Gymnopilus junonius TaxID=109634 RepID=A0A9P5TRI5_GYMJU|nr:hypothetical protein CPB84DRAFT_1769741 [Gymnopilus junonius]
MPGPIKSSNWSRSLTWIPLSSWRALGPTDLRWWRGLIGSRTTYYWIAFLSFFFKLSLELTAYPIIQSKGYHKTEVQVVLGYLFIFLCLWNQSCFWMFYNFFYSKYKGLSVFAFNDVKLGMSVSVALQGSFIFLFK